MNEFVEAAKNSSNGEEDDSKDRYEKVKKEEAGTDKPDPVKQRYNELKEKAKKEYKKQEEKRRKRQKEQEELEDDEDDEGFVTY
ncbi:MAG: hypothetical protein ABEK16_02555 [Candidatus Nanohalobium sp.]